MKADMIKLGFLQSGAAAGRVDYAGHFGDHRRWKATKFRVFMDGGFILCQIDTEGFVGGHIGVLPLHPTFMNTRHFMC